MIIIFYLSCLLAFTAGHIVNYSVIIYSQEVFKSNLLSGIGFGFCFGPPILFGWLAGVLCDRFAPSKIIHASQALFVVAISLMIASHHLDVQAHFKVGLFLLAAFLVGVSWAFVAPARMTALGQLVPLKNLKIASIIFNLLVMLGFGLGPIIISTIRNASEQIQADAWTNVFRMASLFFVLASAALLPLPSKKSNQKPRKAMEELREGIKYAKNHPEVKWLLTSALIGYCLMGPIQVLLPRVARDILALSEIGRGAFLGALAPSLILGGVVSMFLTKKDNYVPIVRVAIILAGSLLAIMSRVHHANVATTLLVMLGVSGGCGLSLIVALLQAKVEDHVRGRIMSQYTIISQVIPASSGIVAGILSHELPVPIALLVCGCAIVFAVFIFNTSLQSAVKENAT